jgi:hypothetical protein
MVAAFAVVNITRVVPLFVKIVRQFEFPEFFGNVHEPASVFVDNGTLDLASNLRSLDATPAYVEFVAELTMTALR